MRWLLILLLLNACNGGLLRGSGEVAPAPHGFVIYCQQNPDRAECGGTK